MGYIGHTPNWTAPTSAPPISGADLTDDSVESGKIKAGTIVDSDINASAAIVTSKVSGAVTSITSHGLATSATTDTTNADNIGSGTIAEARLATLDASKLTGTVADARFPTTLPAASGANLTAIPAANISGVVPAANLGTGTASSSTFLNGAGAYAEAGGGAWTKIETSEVSDAASITITGLDSTYDTYAIALSAMKPVTSSAQPYIRFGDSSGIDSGSGDYDWAVQSINASPEQRNASSEAQIRISHQDGVANTPGDGYGAMMYLHTPGDSPCVSSISGTGITGGQGGVTRYNHIFAGYRKDVITLDRVQFLFSSGNIALGRMTIWGISHA